MKMKLLIPFLLTVSSLKAQTNITVRELQLQSTEEINITVESEVQRVDSNSVTLKFHPTPAELQDTVKIQKISAVSLLSLGVPLTAAGIVMHHHTTDTTSFPFSRHKLERDLRITSASIAAAGVITTVVGTLFLTRARRRERAYFQQSASLLLDKKEKRYGIHLTCTF